MGKIKDYPQASTLTSADAFIVSSGNGTKFVPKDSMPFAPAGYGLGESRLQKVNATTLDAMREAGWAIYYDLNNEIGGRSVALIWCSGENNNVTSFCVQMAMVSSRDLYILARRKNDGIWLPWEWVNPPMQVGVEYRTTERYMGKPVYVKLINSGAVTDNVQKDFSITGSNIETIVSAQSFTDGAMLPYHASASDTWRLDIIGVTRASDHSKVTIKYGVGSSYTGGQSINTILKFTRTTD